MKGISEFVINFATDGGMLYIMIAMFLGGFFVKTAGSLCYDEILDNIEHFQIRKSKIVLNIISIYENEIKMGKEIKNTGAFVEREMHTWRIKGMLVEKISSIGDIFGKLCIIIGLCMAVLVLSTTQEKISLVSHNMRRVYLYIGGCIVLYICLKLWDNVIALDYKRSIIKDEIINYLDNNPRVTDIKKPAVNVEINNLEINREGINKEEINREEINKIEDVEKNSRQIIKKKNREKNTQDKSEEYYKNNLQEEIQLKSPKGVQIKSNKNIKYSTNKIQNNEGEDRKQLENKPLIAKKLAAKPLNNKQLNAKPLNNNQLYDNQQDKKQEGINKEDIINQVLNEFLG